MLTLRRNYDFDNVLAREYKIFDSNFAGTNNVPGLRWIRYKNIESALAPLAFNEIGIYQKSYGIDCENYTIETLNESLVQDYDNCSNNRVGIIRIYASKENFDTVYNSLETDLFVNPATPIPELYNKCMDQVTARESLDFFAKTQVKLMRGKNIVVLVSNYSDSEQASDYFLTIGLIPILFPNLKDKFNKEEMEYFKTLVNRSQVKRISNVKPTDAFNAMCSSQKYEDLIMSVRLQSTITNIVQGRVRQAREKVSFLSSEADTILKHYDQTYKDYLQANKILEDLEATTNEVEEEIKNAIKIENIVKVACQGNVLIEYIKAPVTFFEADECECVMKNYNEDTPIWKFLNETFIEQKYKLNVLNKFYFDYAQGTPFNKPGSMDSNDLANYNCWYNPHTHFYNCLGDYEPQLRKLHNEKDLLMYNNVAIASTKSINFRDGAVTRRWLEDITRWVNAEPNYNPYGISLIDIKAFEDEQGNLHSFRELFMDAPEPVELDVRDTLGGNDDDE